jgi:hypothetical protein
MTDYDNASFNDYVRSEFAKRDAEIARLQRELDELRKQKGLSSAREGLTFNSHTGLWADQAGTLYCPTCLNEDKRNPLKTEKYGWRCTAAEHYHSNPDRHPNEEAGGGGYRGPDSWLER